MKNLIIFLDLNYIILLNIVVDKKISFIIISLFFNDIFISYFIKW